MLVPISGIYFFPQEDYPRTKKAEKEWMLQAARATYSLLFQGNTLFGLNDWTNFNVLRLYGKGQQDILQYRDWFYGTQSAGDGSAPSRINANGTDTMPVGGGKRDIVRGKRIFTTVDFDVVSPMPKLIGIVIAVCTDAGYKVKVKSLNPAHVSQKEEMAWLEYYKGVFAIPESQKYSLPISGSGFYPKTPQQLELMRRNGYFRLTFESAFQNIIQHIFDRSKWVQIEQKTIEDGANIAFKSGRIIRDHKGIVKHIYVDPAKFVIQWNEDVQGDNPTFVGHIEKMKIVDLKEDLRRCGYKKDEIEKVAKLYIESSPLKSWSSTLWTEKDKTTGRWQWEILEVDVLHFEIRSNDEYRYGMKDNGEYGIIDDPNHRYDKTETRTSIYSAKYIIGSEIVYDYGRVPNDTGAFSYYWDKIPGSSLTNRSVPLLNDLQRLFIRYRAEIKNAAPSGYYFDITALANMALSPADQTEYLQQLIATHRQTGVIAGQTVTKRDKTIVSRPIEPMDNGPKNIEKYQGAIANTLMQILDMTGITAILGATPNQSPEKAARLGDIEIQSGNNALFLQKESVWRFRENASTVCLDQTRKDLCYDKEVQKYWQGILTPEEYRSVMAVKDLTRDQLAIILVAMPTREQKADMKQAIRERASAGTRDGLVTLTEADLMYLDRLIDADDIELAEMYAAMTIDERLAKYEEKAGKAAEQNAALATQTAQAVEGVKRETLAMEIQLEEKKERNIQAQKDAAKLQQIALQGQIDQNLQLTEIAGEAQNGKDVKDRTN